MRFLQNSISTFVALLCLCLGLTAEAELPNPLDYINQTCVERLSPLGIKDRSTLEYFCNGKSVDFRCVEEAAYRGAPTYQALFKCSNTNPDDSIVVTRSVLAQNQNKGAIQAVMQVWTPTNIGLFLGIELALNLEKKGISGPFIDRQGHKVLVHGLGNALGSALLGWATGNCDIGVKAAILASMAREQQKISLGYNTEYNSVLWDAVGITGGGAGICPWLQKNVTRPEFLQNLAEKIFGEKASITILPNTILAEKKY